MAAEKGRSFLVKLGDGAGPEVFTTIAASTAARLTINNTTVDVTNKDSNGARELLEDGGVTSLSVSLEGIFTDAAIQNTFQGKALGNSIDNYEIILGDSGDKIMAGFQVASYERGGEYDGAVTFSATLESSGTVTFTAA